ncbi:rho guanine nucleotide exchange factor 11 [Trichechus manatus latirostris]|uniref:Rho guanine nucleotide exchange factor 11 n=1 Tax=Trichechus manatus latirostris TaxID=127582 RepID=A0A2Y9RUU5_TRIMA|nr:rho guanine nucleotide exchange factor 11 [Trichechus manatus latirostris]
MSVRLPQSIDRLASLSSLGDSASERKSPSHHRQPSDASETTGLVQRCVIIQKDQHGFGFTVSGDRIVLVQSVRPGGAAMKAGVKEGDRIIKVNGTMVTNSSHLEVVKLIKSGAYVALTLLGSSPSAFGVSGLQQDPAPAGAPRVTPMIPPPPPPPPLPPPQHITGPKPLQDPEVQKHATQILRNMLRQEEKELQRICEVYNRNPASLLEEQIEGARRRVSQLQLKIQQETGGLVDTLPLYGDTSQRSSEGRLSLDSQEGDSGLDSGTERFPSLSESLMNRNSVLSDPGLDSPRTSPVIMARMAQHHRRQGSDAPVPPSSHQGVDQSPKPLIIGPEEDYDPGYFNNESDIILFYLCAEVYQQTNPKDSRSLGKDIWNIFLEKNAVRTKRTLGLGSLYGENDLLDLDGDPLRERQVAEKQLAALGDILSKYEEDRRTLKIMQQIKVGQDMRSLRFPPSSRSEIRLGRSESLKGREEMKRSRKAENVPRSRSDVDMDAAAEATRLHQSASSSASSLSARSLENPTPPFTPKMGRRSIESPSLGFCTDALLPHLLEDDLGQLSDLEPEPDAQNWQHTVGKDVVAGLSQREIDRQEVINELFVTEASHLRTLRVLDLIFYQRMKKENLMPREELARLFPNLPELIEIHNSWCEAMKKLREEGPIIREISDLMLARFDGPAREELQQVAAQFCSYQSIALELIKTKQRKESRFQLFMQEAESHPQCRRLQLRDLIISEMQRLTKYPLLLENIIKHTEGGTSEHEKLCRARDQCREILKYVNEAVKQTENRHRLEGYQKRLDTTSLERASNPLAVEFKVGGPPLPSQHSLLLSFPHTDKRAFFIICTSELGPPQIYELVALTSSDKNTWMELLEEAVRNATRHPGAAPPPSRPPPLGPQEAADRSPAPSRVGLDDTEVFQRGCSESEPEELPGAGTGPQQRVRGTHPVVLEDPEQGGTGEEAARGALPHPSSPLDGETTGIRTRDPIQLPLPGPLFMEGLAEAALEDVENLRHLILWSLLPGHTVEPQATGEPEDDLTPTPSVISVTSHPWDPGSPGQAPTGDEGDTAQLPGLEGSQPELEDVALCSLEHLPPRTRNSGIWEFPELDRSPAEEVSSTEAAGSYKVVRKAEVAGSKVVPALPDSGQPEPEPPDLEGGAKAAGNCFYVSMPAGPLDSSTDASGAPTSPAQPDSLPTQQTEPQTQLPQLQRGNGDQRRPSRSPPNLALRDVGMIFRTIEQLTFKLNRLKDMELAHRELLKSLGGESSGGTTPVGSSHTEAAKWTDSSFSPVAKEPLLSDSRDSHEVGPCPEDSE